MGEEQDTELKKKLYADVFATIKKVIIAISSIITLFVASGAIFVFTNLKDKLIEAVVENYETNEVKESVAEILYLKLKYDYDAQLRQYLEEIEQKEGIIEDYEKQLNLLVEQYNIYAVDLVKELDEIEELLANRVNQ